MLKIFDSNEKAFNFIMHGPRAWEMLLMVGILTILFLSVINFFIERREQVFSKIENKFIHKIFNWFFWISLAAGFILIQPAWLNAPFVDDSKAWLNPLGVMDFKYVALGALILIGAVALTIDSLTIADIKESYWGELSLGSRSSLILSGLLGIFIVIIMGYVRESARAPWVIYQIIPVPGGAAHPTPIRLVNIFIVWLIVSLLTLSTFWFTSKVTAHHPEKAEEIK